MSRDDASPALDEPRLETARLVLRTFTDDDLAAVFALRSDPQVMRYGADAPWRSVDEAVAYLERDRRERADGQVLRLAAERRDDGVVVGSCALFEFEHACRRAEIGYSLLPAAWGRGYAQEMVGRLLDHAFGALALNRVEADVDPRNEASTRLLERLGFRREGLLRERWIVDGEVSDSLIYGLLAAEHPATA